MFKDWMFHSEMILRFKSKIKYRSLNKIKDIQFRWDERKQKRLERKLVEITEGCGVNNKRRM